MCGEVGVAHGIMRLHYEVEVAIMHNGSLTETKQGYHGKPATAVRPLTPLGTKALGLKRELLTSQTS